MSASFFAVAKVLSAHILVITVHFFSAHALAFNTNIAACARISVLAYASLLRDMLASSARSASVLGAWISIIAVNFIGARAVPFNAGIASRAQIAVVTFTFDILYDASDIHFACLNSAGISIIRAHGFTEHLTGPFHAHIHSAGIHVIA
jgi:hypothetical protein